MTIDAYLNPDFTLIKKLIFFGAALIGVIICNLIMFGIIRIAVAVLPRNQREEEFAHKSKVYQQLFYEMIISGTSVMSFACAYVVLNHVYSVIEANGISTHGAYGRFYMLWSDGKDFILLLLICLSCVLNTILDKLIIPLGYIDKDQKATIRMLGMFYMIIILLFLNLIGDESEYSPVMMYYLGLMVGRFVYFDASFMDFITAIKNVCLKLPLLVLGLSLSGALCFIGFKAGFLLERNYYIVGAFYTHLFLLAAVFILHLISLITSHPKKSESVG